MKKKVKGLWIVASIGENWLSNYCLVPTPSFFCSLAILNKKKKSLLDLFKRQPASNFAHSNALPSARVRCSTIIITSSFPPVFCKLICRDALEVLIENYLKLSALFFCERGWNHVNNLRFSREKCKQLRQWNQSCHHHHHMRSLQLTTRQKRHDWLRLIKLLI